MNSNRELPLPVERVHAPSAEIFKKLYADPGKPVLISGVVSEWNACSQWTIPYFNSIAGDRLVTVRRMRNGAYIAARREEMKLMDYLEIVSNKAVGNERVYLGGQDVKKIFPEIVDDYTVPQYIESEKIDTVCYIGSQVHSQIHFHPYGKALLCVVSGRKRVKLFAPDQTPYLYQKFNFSKIEGEPVDLNSFPLYRNARYYECEVHAGEMLFFPIYWWHGVETDDFTSAIVFFWDDSRKTRWNPPEGIRWYYPPLFEASSWLIEGKKRLQYFKS